MSIKLMSQVWECQFTKAEQSVMLAMADHAQDDGTQCYPSVDKIAWKTDYSSRQVQRVIHELRRRGILVLVREAGRGRGKEYRIDLRKADPKPDFKPKKGDTVSSNRLKDDTVSPHKKHDMVSPFSANGDTMSPTNETQKGDIDDVKGDILRKRGDIAMSPESSLEPIQPSDDDDNARETIHTAWLRHYGDAMPEKVSAAIDNLVANYSEAAVIHGITAAAAASARTFSYIATCARNYVPPAVKGNGKDYHVELEPRPSLPPPTTSVSPQGPWAICLAETKLAMPASSFAWLEESQLIAADDVADDKGNIVPLYRVVIDSRHEAGLDWLRQRAADSIRKRLGSILGHPIHIEIIIAESEPVP